MTSFYEAQLKQMLYPAILWVTDYLSKCFEPLHTQGRQWLIEEIDEFIEIRKNKEA